MLGIFLIKSASHNMWSKYRKKYTIRTCSLGSAFAIVFCEVSRFSRRIIRGIAGNEWLCFKCSILEASAKINIPVFRSK